MNGLELKLMRVKAGLTLWELGRATGLHPARLSEMERDQRRIADTVLVALGQKLSEAGPVRAE